MTRDADDIGQGLIGGIDDLDRIYGTIGGTVTQRTQATESPCPHRPVVFQDHRMIISDAYGLDIRKIGAAGLFQLYSSRN
ncbi:hypothetical protein D1872_278570 [compost metagenome]